MKIDISKHKWLQSAAMKTLFAAFPDGSLRFAGGCVRNALMGREASDIDLATQLEPDEMMAAL